jgi:hypothetical protein
LEVFHGERAADLFNQPAKEGKQVVPGVADHLESLAIRLAAANFDGSQGDH